MIVLALVVVLTVLASAVATSGRRAVEEAQVEIERFEGDLDMRSTQETLLFMLSTHRRNIAGLAALPSPAATAAMLDDDTDGASALPSGNDIRLDGTSYRGLGSAAFALQDDAGLLSPNWASPALLEAFYSKLGVPPEQWSGLEAKRLDYQDPDSLHRLDGAEAEHYEKAGRPPPPNRAVATPLEFRRILQWDDALASLDDDRLLGILSAHRGGTINLNSAPASVLALIPGMDEASAQRLVSYRVHSPIVSVWQVRELFPIPPFMEDNVTLFPNRAGNLILWDRRRGVKRLVHWSLTPYAIGGPPWQIDYEVILARENQSDDALGEAPSTPLFTPPDPAGKRFEPDAGE
ncbi:type II secretion system protein GspK [Luteimonas sp. MHLX1A]|uniref:type II secretion system protein GspK n=1 Tax=Alterluteimonas muca TaxID=2878684 RepID=UPI001E65AF5C|nr:general secretion pathway protein GspK [Luteimonas sp. MHLX1A]